MLQEALTNVQRQSGAKNVSVTRKAQGSELIAEVLDDGRGFGSETAPGVALSRMHERAAVVGGRLKIESAAGQGTRVQLRVPVPQKG